MKQKTLDDLQLFLDKMKSDEVIAPTTVSARKAAIKKIFSHSTKDESENVLEVDISELASRLTDEIGASTLDTYKSRVQSTVDEFARYIADPDSYNPQVLRRNRLAHGQGLDGQQKLGSAEILLRPDLIVSIKGLPFDLSESEAKKIGSVVLAMAPTSEGE